jgi:hypothetical protein
VSVGLVEQGLVVSVARPDGNLTGLELPAIEVSGKRLELLKDAVSTISRVAVLVDPAQASHADVPSNLAREAHALGVQLQRVEAGAPAAFEAAFAAMVQGGADALLIMESPLFAAHRQQLLALALQYKLPTMAYGRHLAEAGSLLAYGADPRALCQRSAVFVQKILQGVKPADLPIEGATFQLVVNLKTAEAPGGRNAGVEVEVHDLAFDALAFGTAHPADADGSFWQGGRKITTAHGNGALVLLPLNLSRPGRNQISAYGFTQVCHHWVSVLTGTRHTTSAPAWASSAALRTQRPTSR